MGIYWYKHIAMSKSNIHDGWYRCVYCGGYNPNITLDSNGELVEVRPCNRCLTPIFDPYGYTEDANVDHFVPDTIVINPFIPNRIKHK